MTIIKKARAKMESNTYTQRQTKPNQGSLNSNKNSTGSLAPAITHRKKKLYTYSVEFIFYTRNYNKNSNDK
jgi:hypothetical protein